MADLSKVEILIKTFLRDSCLFNTIAAIKRTLPECRMLIADCGEMTEEKDGIYSDLSREGHLCFTLPFDFGFGGMSNTLASAVSREHALIASDDFDFNPPEVRRGLERLVCVSDSLGADIASGRVNNRPYEFLLDEYELNKIKEVPLNYELYTGICDLTVNYSLIRKRVFENVKWDDTKIGQGEHFAFFWDCKKAGFVTVWVPNVNISEQENQNSERYNKYRNRALDPGRSCFDKRGITTYVCGNGQVDYDRG